MRNATVKQALASSPEGVQHHVQRRRGTQRIEPTPELDAVLTAESTGYIRIAAKEIGWLIGCMVLVATAMVVIAQQPDEPFGLTPRLIDALLIISATTWILGLLLFFRRRHQARMMVNRLTPEQRGFSRTTGTLILQERLSAMNATEYWLKPPNATWMSIDRSTFEQLEPVTVRAQSNDMDFRRQTGNDVVAEWSVPDATILFHRHTQTIVEIVAQDGGIIHRHPRYQGAAN